MPRNGCGIALTDVNMTFITKVHSTEIDSDLTTIELGGIFCGSHQYKLLMYSSNFRSFCNNLLPMTNVNGFTIFQINNFDYSG